MKKNNGKEKCEALKAVRKEIASLHGITYHSEECCFDGECKGTCPKCESEVRYLENELQKKGVLKKSLLVACALPILAACSEPEMGAIYIEPSSQDDYRDSVKYEQNDTISEMDNLGIHTDLVDKI